MCIDLLTNCFHCNFLKICISQNVFKQGLNIVVCWSLCTVTWCRLFGLLWRLLKGLIIFFWLYCVIFFILTFILFLLFWWWSCTFWSTFWILLRCCFWSGFAWFFRFLELQIFWIKLIFIPVNFLKSLKSIKNYTQHIHTPNIPNNLKQQQKIKHFHDLPHCRHYHLLLPLPLLLILLPHFLFLACVFCRALHRVVVLHVVLASSSFSARLPPRWNLQILLLTLHRCLNYDDVNVPQLDLTFVLVLLLLMIFDDSFPSHCHHLDCTENEGVQLG